MTDDFDGVQGASYWQAWAKREATELMQEFPPTFEHYSQLHALASAAWLRGFSEGTAKTLDAVKEALSDAAA